MLEWLMLIDIGDYMDSYKKPFVGKIIYSTYSKRFKHNIVHEVLVKDEEHLFNYTFMGVLYEETAELIDVISLDEPKWSVPLDVVGFTVRDNFGNTHMVGEWE